MTAATTDAAFTTRDTGPATERIIARDLVRRGLVAAPVAIAVGALVAGAGGAASVAFAASTAECICSRVRCWQKYSSSSLPLK